MSKLWLPGAIKKPLPINPSRDPIIDPAPGDIFHIAVSESASLFDFFKGLPSGVESTGYIRRDGKFEQYRPLNVECDANGDGNSFAFNGHRGGFNSWETQGGEFGEWSDKQIETIKFIIRFKHDNYGTPLRLAPDWNKAGFGYHRLHNEWNKNGHSCPGPDRVKQFNRVIVPWMRGGAPMKEDEVDEKDINAIADKVVEKLLAAPITGLDDGTRTSRSLKGVLAVINNRVAETRDAVNKAGGFGK
jgi:hypothetical protein